MDNARKNIAELLAALPERPTVLEVTKVLKQLKSIDIRAAGLKPIKLAVVSSFTFDMLIEPLIVHGYCDGFQISVYNTLFGQYMQEMINPASQLHKFDADVVFFAVRLQDACPDLYYSFSALDKRAIDSKVEQWQTEWLDAIKAFRANNAALILCANYEQPPYPSLGLADAEVEASQCATIMSLNKWMRGLAGQIKDFHIIDVDGLAARCGRSRWTDPRMWFLARSAIAPCFMWDYVGEIMRLLRPTRGRVRKVLALDCDNTLWGGILGEVGFSGIALGHDFPGNAYLAFQKRALELHHRGVVLIIASKNDHSAVMEVFERHPEMVLRPQHISYFGVNWNPKPENLQKAASVLNLGLDSFVFVDDNHVECAMVHSMLPEVLSICLPEDPAQAEMTLAKLDCFDQLVISAEDRQRGQMYRQEVSRAGLKTSVKDLETFYHQLKMVAAVSRNDVSNIPRAAQLTQRTNQFNMTTIRRTESQIRELMSSDRHDVFTLRLTDRFGDNGVVGLAILEHKDQQNVLETFLMSCRVLGRTVEAAFLSWLGTKSLNRGQSRLVALYRPTSKNLQFSEFYKSWGMTLETSDVADNTQRWSYDLAAGTPELKLPPWIEIKLISDERG